MPLRCDRPCLTGVVTGDRHACAGTGPALRLFFLQTVPPRPVRARGGAARIHPNNLIEYVGSDAPGVRPCAPPPGPGEVFFVRRVEKIRRRLGAARASHGSTAPQPELRQGGAYSLPDGTELVAAPAPGGRYLLYHPLVWAGQAWVVEMPV